MRTQTRKTHKSKVFAAVHETVSDLHGAGLVGKRTMERFDESCQTPVISPEAPSEPPLEALRELTKPNRVE